VVNVNPGFSRSRDYLSLAMFPESVWLPTPCAALALGRSTSYLKRLRDTHGGFLESGKHYCVAPSSNAPITWHVELVRQELNRRGMER
jgi:hypothetical protein